MNCDDWIILEKSSSLEKSLQSIMYFFWLCRKLKNKIMLHPGALSKVQSCGILFGVELWIVIFCNS